CIVVPICTDNTKNGNETDKDCGGGLCPKCADNLGCQQNNDCTSSLSVSICTDNTKNGNETDKDCGGGLCPKCADNLGCQQNNDCISDVCQQDICQGMPIKSNIK
ncbi:unnamed protein product, partial [Rotaria sordida]